MKGSPVTLDSRTGAVRRRASALIGLLFCAAAASPQVITYEGDALPEVEGLTVATH